MTKSHSKTSVFKALRFKVINIPSEVGQFEFNMHQINIPSIRCEQVKSFMLWLIAISDKELVWWSESSYKMIAVAQHIFSTG